MKTLAEIDAERQAAILARAPLLPKQACHYCAEPLGKGALWCAYSCAQSYEAERDQLLHDIMPPPSSSPSAPA
jgi:hypothetical protein